MQEILYSVLVFTTLLVLLVLMILMVRHVWYRRVKLSSG